MRELDTGPQSIDRPASCVLIDEPEPHLHPNLQIKVLDYLRVLTSQRRTQVIVATHSPTIVEGATFDELFLLRPVELVAPEDNQLVRIAQDEDRLAALRSLFGSTHNLAFKGASESGVGACARMLATGARWRGSQTPNLRRLDTQNPKDGSLPSSEAFRDRTPFDA